MLALIETGERVRNTYATYLLLGHSPEKFGLIPHSIIKRHLLIIKTPVVKDEYASY